MHNKIKQVKNKLIDTANKKGIYENFGQKEIRQLLDNPLCNPYGTNEQRQFHKEVMMLDEWAMTYCG